MSNIAILNVMLHGNLIGTITQIGNDRNLFAFTDDYIENRDRDTLGLGFKDKAGELITEFRPYQTKLMPFFSNLLPEGRMREYLAERAQVNPARDFHLLGVLGADLPGALQVIPADGEIPPTTESGAKNSTNSSNTENDTVLKFSLAGVQIKFSAIEQTRAGLSISAQGQGGNWIVKLPSREFDGVPENEYSMMTLAKSAGIEVPDIQLLDIERIEGLPEDVQRMGKTAFAIKRFDRADNNKLVHIEDFAQIFDLYAADKYKKASFTTIGQVLSVETSTESSKEFIRRLTFNTLIGNGDMHIKNWSVIYPDRKHPELSPAYDFVSTIPYIRNDAAALRFSRSNKFENFTQDELRHLANRAHLPEAMVVETARETVERFHGQWKQEKGNLPLYKDVTEAIDQHLKTLPKI